MSMLMNCKDLVNVKLMLGLGKKLIKIELNKASRLWDCLRSQFPSLHLYSGANAELEARAGSWKVYNFLT